jgi:pimeloyl-ACP methyl ester carboxylesterase
MTTMANLTIRPFEVRVPHVDLADLQRRVTATRWPGKELVADRSQGVQLATVQALVTYWGTGYDWRTCEAQPNALPQFMTEIDGLDVYFIHVRSRHESALPLIITYGWPGSVIEMLGVVGPLTDPTAHGGRSEHAFDLVLPSLPGYGFSEQPESVGWDPGRTARAWAELMSRLGYTRYVAQGGDVGAGVADAMAIQAPDGLAGIHLDFLRRPPLEVLAVLLRRAPVPQGFTESERAALAALGAQARKGYAAEQGQSPQTIGYPLTDSPVGLAAWMLDHDADSYVKISRAFTGGPPSGGLTLDHILYNITLYWVTRTATSVLGGRPEHRSRGRAAAARGLAAGSLHGVPRRDLPGPAQLGREGSTPTSSTAMRPAGAATSRPGRSRSCSRKRSARASGRSAS